VTLADRLRAIAAYLRALAPPPGQLRAQVDAGGAVAAVQMRPTRWLAPGVPDPTSYRPVP
jgi:hypothetical protein